jgi:hypothetical protein
MWWVIGAVASFIVLFCYCSCVLAGRADEKKNEWLSQEEERTTKSVPSERGFRDERGSGVCPAPEPCTLLHFGSSLAGVRENI